MNFRTRLTLLTCASIAVALVIASLVTYTLAYRDAYDQVDDALARRIEFIRAFQKLEGARDIELDTTSPVMGVRIPGVGPGEAGGFTRVLDRDGKEVALARGGPPPGSQTRGQPGPLPEESDLPADVRRQLRASRVQLPITDAAERLARSDEDDIERETVESGDFHFRVVTGRISDDFVVQSARPIDETEDFLERLALLLVAVSVGGIALSVAAAYAVTSAATRPIHELTELAVAVRESGDLSQRVTAEGSDDLARLARSFNEMLQELERSVERQLRLVDDASHQMRTPLASIRTNMDVLMRARKLDEQMTIEIMGDLSTQVDELTGLVRDLVDLASNVESTLERGPMRLDAVAEEAIRLVRGAFPALRFDTSLAPSTIHGSEERLVRMVQNLLHNAAKWSPAEGTIDVHVAGEELRVVDHGPGVADDEKTRIFERFHRAADARDVPGSGLGLAIVQQVVVDHGGAVRVEDTDGGGATFVVWLPRDEELDA